MRLLKLLLLLTFAYAVHTQEGMMVQVSEQGLNFFAKMGGDFLTAKLSNFSIPNYSGNSGSVVFNLKNISIANISKPDISLKIDNGQGLIVSMPNISTEFNFNWDYQLGPGWLKVKDSGSALASTSSLSMKLYLKFEKNATGVPKAVLTSCEATVAKVDFKVVGKLTTVYKLYLSIYEKVIKTKMQSVVCEQTTKLVNSDPSFTLASLNTMALIDDQMYLDYSLLAAPTFKAGYMESMHSGEFVSLSGIRYPDAALPYTLIADDSTPTKMVRMRVTERMVNSAAYVYHKLGVFSLAQNFTIPDIENLLGYTSDYPLIGNVMAKEAPKLVINSDTVTAKSTALITLDVSTDGVTTKNILTVEMSLEIEANVRFEGNNVKGNVTKIVNDVKVINNKIASISDAELVAFFQTIVEASQESINNKTNEGFSMPSLKSVAFKDATLKQGAHYFTLDADIASFNATSAATNATDVQTAAPTQAAALPPAGQQITISDMIATALAAGAQPVTKGTPQ